MTRLRKRQHEQAGEGRLDETVEDSFPASDPPAHSGITGVRRRRSSTRESENAGSDRAPSHERGHDARPTGSPTWDRHAQETAHAWEDEDPA